jgi:hypothetical protein
MGRCLTPGRDSMFTAIWKAELPVARLRKQPLSLVVLHGSQIGVLLCWRFLLSRTRREMDH